KKTILKFLKPMQKGYLKITLPDDSVIELGNIGNSLRADVHIHEEHFFKRAFFYGDIGFAEAFMEEEWTTTDLTKLISWFLLNIENSPTLSGSAATSIALNAFQFVNKLFHSKRKN